MLKTVELPAVRQARPIEMLAMKRAIPEAIEKDAAKTLSQGSHDVDFTVRVMGTLKKGEPFDMTCPMVVPWQTLFALALTRLNKATGDSMENIAASLMVETDEGLKRDPEAIEKQNASIKTHVEEVCGRLIERTRRPVDGRITTRLNVVVLSPVDDASEHVTEVISVPAGTVPSSKQSSMQDVDIPANLS